MKGGTFIIKNFALKQGRTKEQYIASCRSKGVTARYSGKIIRDQDGNVLRQPGFYLS